MTAHAKQASELQKLKSRAAAATIENVAMELFDRNGFDATTVDEIASAAGISQRTFFRYFRTKEEVVVGDHLAFGDSILAALEARPEGEDAWLSLRYALKVLSDNVALDPGKAARTMRVVNGTAILRAHSLEKHLTWARLLSPEVARRLAACGDGADIRQLQADTLVHVALTCLDVALARLANASPEENLERLLEQTFAAARST